MTVSRPGEPPRYPSRPYTTVPDILAWEEYVAKSDVYWKELARLVGLQIPCLGLEYIGGGEVITVIYEDESYAWLGGWPEDDYGDGPYAFGDCLWVGGYRYPGGPDSDGSVFTKLHMVRVEDQDDIQSVADSLVKAARELASIPITESC